MIVDRILILAVVPRNTGFGKAQFAAGGQETMKYVPEPSIQLSSGILQVLMSSI